MKFYIVTNDILKTDSNGNATCTDEPKWLKNEIDKWNVGGRICCVENALKSVIISPDDDLLSKSKGDLEEIDLERFQNYINIVFPSSERELEDGTKEIILQPSIEFLCKKYWKY
jgi:hypothetical protein